MPLLSVESETFETAGAPLFGYGRPGPVTKIEFYKVQDILEDALRKEEERLWLIKVENAKTGSQNLTRNFQYGLVPNDAEQAVINAFASATALRLPVSRITYSRLELAASKKSREIPNVLGVSEIVKSPTSYLFVQRSKEVAYHGGREQLYTLVGGGFPRNMPPIQPEDMTVGAWLAAQEKAEHGIELGEIKQRIFLGIILDKTLGYKPEIAMCGEGRLSLELLAGRAAIDAWEKKGVIEVPATIKDVIRILLEHRELERHVPSGYGTAILELAKLGGLRALDQLNYEGTQRGGPLVEYHVKTV